MSIYDAVCNQRGCLTHTPASRDELLTTNYRHFTEKGAEFLVARTGLTTRSSPRSVLKK